MTVSIETYCQKNILVIPQTLFSMKECQVLLQHGNSIIFYKYLAEDLTDVEFYVNTPCIIYIERGMETITTHDNQCSELKANTAIFFPQGINLHSDYVKSTDNLIAYLIFFDQELIVDFLRTKMSKELSPKINSDLLTLTCGEEIPDYLHSIKLLHKHLLLSADLSQIKLLELLHLLTQRNDKLISAMHSSIKKMAKPKRNLKRLLTNKQAFKLTVADLANLSGRSYVSFNRDFKALFDMPPKQWLQDKRLSYARTLLTDKNSSVTETAVELGYENVSHFINAFKGKYEVTPKQFKLSNES
jgi:AraC-like DNA-binding protein